MICVFDSGDSCIGLAKKDCKECKFYKTEEQLITERRKAESRLKRLHITKRVNEQTRIHKMFNNTCRQYG